MQSLGCRLMAGQRILVPSMGVRLPPSQPLHLLHMARSSSGLGRRPLKAEITSSNLVRATKHLIPELPRRFGFFITAILDRPQNRPLFFLLQYMLYVLLMRLAGTIGKIYLN